MRRKIHFPKLTLVVAFMVGGTGCGTPASSSSADLGSAVNSDGPASSGSDAATTIDSGTIPTDHFSFFVTSLKVLQDLSGNQLGFGGDLRFGETGAGAGLRGADKICATIAERSMPGAGKKTWRAFLSAVADEKGVQVNAIDRIGDGPWYDRLGRVFAMTKTGVLANRPDGDATIKNDFPNEDGVPNHRPDPNQAAVDNHDMLTGSDTAGKLYSAKAVCKDWTANAGDKTNEGQPRVGHSWPRGGGGGGPGGGGENWMSALTESGCAPGVNLVEMGGPMASSNTVGSGGGYGGFYCFALTP